MTGQEKEGLINVFDPLLKISIGYINKMRAGEVPVDMEAYILLRRAMYEGFDVPLDDWPPDPTGLKDPIQLHSPLGEERIS